MSTMLGTSTFDAQMTDYPAQGDLDVLMQAHSTDPWTAQDDGIMEEDTSFSMLTAKNPDSATVTMFMPAATEGSDQQNEVEMEDYEHHSEYEMLDESEVIVEDNDHTNTTTQEELLDVEVVDLQPSPETSLTMAAPPALEPRADEATTARHHSRSPLPPPPLDIPPEVNHDVPPLESVPGTVEHPIAEDAISETVVTIEGESHETETAAPGLTESNDPPREIHAPSVDADHSAAHHLEPPLAALDAELPSNTLAAPSEHASHDTEDRAPSDQEVFPEHRHEAEPAIDETDVGDHVEAESNPHEIADGVFIEPVPAVIVHASFSDQPFVLFDRPPVSRPHSPSPDDDVPSDIAVLLHDRPTLYYGPLSDLFAALREEEFLAQQLDMHHVELGFSVETLQLSITEDNIHAKEFSLFQLNTLHDSFHTGSLRVTLLQQAPRFISRYHELQEHLHRLGASGNDDGLLTAVPSSTGESIAEQREVIEQVSLETGEADQALHHHENEVMHREPEFNHEDGEHEPQEGEKESEPEVVEVSSHNRVQEPAEAGESGDNDVVYHLGEHREAQSDPHRAAEEPVTHVDGEVGEVQVEGQADHAEEVHIHADEPESPHLEHRHDIEQANIDQSAVGAEEATEPSTIGGGDHVEHAQQAEEGEEKTVEDGFTEGADHVADGDEGHEYQEDEHEHDGGEQLEEAEYGLDYDPDQLDGDELQEDLETGDGSEHSGDVTYEAETQDTDLAGNEDEGHQEYVDERSPSPGAEDELPPIDTSLLEAVNADGAGEGSALASASTQDEWLDEGDGGGVTGEESQDSETQHSHSEEGNENAEHYVDDDSLVYHEDEAEHPEWDQDLDGQGEVDPSWDGEYADHEEQVANDSAASVRSKRSFHEVDGDDDEVNELGPTPSPDSKRSRLE